MNPIHVFKIIALGAACVGMMAPQMCLSAEAPVVRAKKVHKVSTIPSTQKGALSGYYQLHNQVTPKIKAVQAPYKIRTVKYEEVKKVTSLVRGGAAQLTSNNKSTFVPIWNQ